MLNFTLPEKFTHIFPTIYLHSNSLKNLLTEYKLMYFLLKLNSSLVRLCSFALLTGHTEIIICTFLERKFRGSCTWRTEEGVTVQKLSKYKRNQGNVYKRECGTVSDDSLLLQSLCTAWGLQITLLLLQLRHTRYFPGV